MSLFVKGPERTPVKSPVGKGVPGSADTEEKENDKSTLSPASTFSNGSSANHRPGSKNMSKDEVSKLVNDALRRAREATTPKSSPLGSPKLSPNSQKKGGSSTKPSPTNSSPNVKSSPTNSATMNSDYDGVLSPNREMILSVDDTSGVVSPSDASRASSSDVIRRVEEEIASAKKAAEEAQQRLTYAMSSKSSNSWSIDEPKLSPTMELTSLLDQGPVFDQEPSDTDMSDILRVNSNSGTELDTSDEQNMDATETSFVIARDMINEEFNFVPPELNFNLSEGVEEETPDTQKDDQPSLTDGEQDDQPSLTDGEQDDVQPSPDSKEGEPAKSVEKEEGILEDKDSPSEGSDFLGNVDETNETSGANQKTVEEKDPSATDGDTSAPVVEDDSSARVTLQETSVEEEEPEEMESAKEENQLEKDLVEPAQEEELEKEAESEPDIQEVKGPSDPVPSEAGSSQEGAAIEEKKEERSQQGPWDGFLSIFTGKNDDRSKANDGAEEGEVITEDGAQAEDVANAASFESRDFHTPRASELIKEINENNEQGCISPDNPGSVTKAPWWTTPEISEAEEAPTEDVGEIGSEERPEKPSNADDAEDSNEAQGAELASTLEDGTIAVQPATVESVERLNKETSEQDEAPDNVEGGEQGRTENSRQVHFKEPYPHPAPLAKPRAPEDVKRDHALGDSKPPVRWTNPKPQLQQLLLAATGESLPRRSNALGAMKVLSLKKKNQVTLARTKGFLDALVSALNASIPPGSQELGLVARARAVVTLLHVSEPKDNRIILIAHRGLPQALVKVVAEDYGEARAHACGALAMLAKTASNREAMASIDHLVPTLADVVKGRQKSLTEEEEKQEETDNEDDASHDGSDAGSSTADDSSTHSGDSSYSESSTKVTDDLIVEATDSIKQKKAGLQEEFETCARYNACAALAHLSKHCAISDILGQDEELLGAMMSTSVEFSNPIHTKCVEILCNLTRFPSNNAALSRNSVLVDTLVQCGKSKMLNDRVWALRAFQNMASDASSKLPLATAPLLTLLSICAVRPEYDEQAAAVAAIYNLSTDAGAVVPLTNTRNVVATLVHLAHSPSTAADVRQMACDALATIGLWLQTLASAGTVPEGMDNVPLPSHTTTGWDRWD